METMRVPDSIRVTQSERLAALRQGRDAGAWSAAMDAVEAAARGTDNLMPHLLRAVEARATVGEVSHRLRAVWGEYAG